MNGHTRGYGASGDFYRKCAAKGMTQAETARAWGVSRVAVSRFASETGTEFSPAFQPKSNAPQEGVKA